MNGKKWRNKERRKPEECERNRDWVYLGSDSGHMGLERQLVIDVPEAGPAVPSKEIPRTITPLT